MIGFFERLKVEIPSMGGTLILGICNVRTFNRARAAVAAGGKEACECCDELMEECGCGEVLMLPHAEKAEILKRYIKALEGIVEENGELLEIPHSDCVEVSSLPACKLSAHTLALKTAADYSGVSIPEMYDTNWLVFRLLLADAVKFNSGGTEKGIEWLNAAYSEMFEPFDRRAFLRGE